ncbi:ADP-ribosylglycohydrolase family protein [Hungatella hathewayi]|uniref:ADP-ribosylglycohydrolase family protein n=1 Tax=Hungatella hathewayi TaxID=154046 RepID=UPI0035651FEA
MLEKQMWMKYAPEIMTEWQQLKEEGYEVDDFREACEALMKKAEVKDCEAEAAALASRMAQAHRRSDYPYTEPSEYEEILALLGEEGDNGWNGSLSQQALKDKIAGAWIGRISGCLLGKPMEGLKSPVITQILKESGNYPMVRYVDSRDFSEDLREKAEMDTFLPWQKCWIDTIGGKAPVDDDTNYTVLAMKLIEEYGTDFCPNDVLEAWLRWLPMFAACTAERMAYRNAAVGMYAPETAVYKNPYREWIGAQIRGDFFGYINPGKPRAAAAMAWRDASISHVKNGIYGEMFVAAMIAKAAVCDDMEQVIEAGLAEIPPASRLSEEIQKVLGWYRQGVSAEEAAAEIHRMYDEYSQHDWCHTNSNAMIVAMALLYGNKEFGKTICLAVQTAFDTDCNGATAGSVIGIMLGEKAIPKCWTECYHKTLRTSIAGYHEVTIDMLTDKTMKLIKG